MESRYARAYFSIKPFTRYLSVKLVQNKTSIFHGRQVKGQKGFPHHHHYFIGETKKSVLCIASCFKFWRERETKSNCKYSKKSVWTEAEEEAPLTWWFLVQKVFKVSEFNWNEGKKVWAPICGNTSSSLGVIFPPLENEKTEQK